MADITYIVNQDNSDNISGVEKFSQADSQLISQFGINTLFDRNKNYIELHIFNLADEILQSDYNYTSYLELGNAESAGKEGASVLTIDAISDIKEYGYLGGDVKLLYHFVNDLFSARRNSTQFFIQGISEDRTELKLQTFDLSNQEIITYVRDVQNRISNQPYFNEFRLNFQNNDLLIGINIDTLVEGENNVVTVKLYEPLPGTYGLKSTLSITELVSDSIVFEVDSSVEPEVELIDYIRPANFNLDIIDNDVIPTQYFNYDELFSYPVNNTNSQVYSLVSEKGAELSIDHTDYSDFIHFSSAYERLANFKYKLQLIEGYSSSLAQIGNATSQSVGVTGSVSYYEKLTQGILDNLDHYERYLYFQSSSYAWPKSNNTSPYINRPTTNVIAQSWYTNQLSIANRYDLSNLNAVVNTIPSFLRDDPNNENYLTFIHMIGQHFDNLWIYTKGVSDKYDADNRLNSGISKDLVGEVLKNFGVKLYTSNKSIEDLFSSFVGQAYQSGSEKITTYVTGSITGSNTPIQPSSVDNYQREVYKRIYHNLPLLLKSKGTERGLRALINCFGIPSDIFDIKVYGGRNINERPFYGDYRYYTSSLDKIRLDNTGSLITGSTLSQYTSIIKREYKYTDDLHPIELGFSPTDNVDNYIISKSLSTASLASFNIDDYIGDPRNLYLDGYYNIAPIGSVSGSLVDLTDRIMSGSSAYNVYDFVRLIKFFDNTIFKMVKDFIPARSTADTGIIIKPHLLGRSKAKSVKLTGSRPEHTGSIDTAFTEGDSGGSYNSQVDFYNTSYVDTIQTPQGISGPFTQQGVNTNLIPVSSHAHEEPRFNGELDNSGIEISDGELNRDNTYKAIENVLYPYNITFVSASDEICLLNVNAGLTSPVYITSSTAPLVSTDFFTYTNASSQYTLRVPKTGGTDTSITFPTTIQSLQPTFPGLTQYSTGSIKVNNVNYTLGVCTSSIDFIYATCSLSLTQVGQDINDVIMSPYLNNTTPYNLTTWFTNHPSQSVQYTITSASVTTVIDNSGSYQFPTSSNGSPVTITISDPKAGPGCRLSKTVNVGNCFIGTIPTGSNGLNFIYSRVVKRNIGLADISNEFGEITDNAPGRSPLGYTTSITETIDTTYVKYIELASPSNQTGRGLQSYFTPYPPDPGTSYSVFFISKPSNVWTARTVISNQTPVDLGNYYAQWDIPVAVSPNVPPGLPGVNGGNPPIRIVSPFLETNPDLAVRAIVIEAYPPLNPACKRRITLYPGSSGFGGIPTAGNAVFESIDIPIDWNSRLLGQPLAGVDTLFGVPIRTYQ